MTLGPSLRPTSSIATRVWVCLCASMLTITMLVRPFAPSPRRRPCGCAATQRGRRPLTQCGHAPCGPAWAPMPLAAAKGRLATHPVMWAAARPAATGQYRRAVRRGRPRRPPLRGKQSQVSQSIDGKNLTEPYPASADMCNVTLHSCRWADFREHSRWSPNGHPNVTRSPWPPRIGALRPATPHAMTGVDDTRAVDASPRRPGPGCVDTVSISHV
jgi:hypothetical protein